MPTIQGPKSAPEYVSGKRHVVTAIAPAKLLGVNWVDGDGAKRMALVIQFGKDTEDNLPGVFVLADEEEMRGQLKIANRTVKAGVRKWLAEQENQSPEQIPDSLPMIDGGSEDPAAGSADITKIEVG